MDEIKNIDTSELTQRLAAVVGCPPSVVECDEFGHLTEHSFNRLCSVVGSISGVIKAIHAAGLDWMDVEPLTFEEVQRLRERKARRRVEEPFPGLLRAVGETIHRLRRRRSLRLTDVARATGIGIGTLSRIETGRRAARLDEIASLAAVLATPVAVLLSAVDPAIGSRSEPG